MKLTSFVGTLVAVFILAGVAMFAFSPDADSSSAPDGFICSKPTSLKTWEQHTRPKHLQSVYVCKNSQLVCAVTSNAIDCN